MTGTYKEGSYIPNYDKRCNICGYTMIDVLEPVNTPRQPCPNRTEGQYACDNGRITFSQPCGGTLERAWLTKPPSVIGDECDVWIKHGICNEDGTPRRYRSKAEMRLEAKRRGLINRVEHVGSPGSDKNRHGHTTRWV